MGYNINWQVENHVLLVTIEHDLSLAELGDLSADINAAFDGTVQDVHVIFHTKSLRRVPTNILDIRKNTEFLNHPNMGRIVMVGANSLVKYLASTVTAFVGIRVSHAKGLDEAVETLKKSDSTFA